MESSIDCTEDLQITAKELRKLQDDVLAYFNGIGQEWCAYCLGILADAYESLSN